MKYAMTLERGYFLVVLWTIIAGVIAFCAAIAPGVNVWMRDNQHLSGWVQAVGSVLAIVGALLVMQVQLESQRRSEAEKVRQGRLQQLHALLVILSTVEVDVRSVQTAAPERWGRYAAHTLRNSQNELHRIDPYALISHTLLFQIATVKMGLHYLIPDVDEQIDVEANLRRRAGALAAHAQTAADLCKELLRRLMTAAEWADMRQQQDTLVAIRKTLGVPVIERGP
jgi:hypothetical protein